MPVGPPAVPPRLAGFRRRFGLVAGLLTLGGGGQRLGADPHWISVSGPHFVVISDASEGATREVAAEVSAYEEVLGKFIHADPARLKPLTIVLFARDAEFDAFKPRTQDGRNIDELQQELDTETGSETGGGHEWEVIAAVREMNYSDVTRRLVLAGCVSWYIRALDVHIPVALYRGTQEVLAAFETRNDYARFGRPIPRFAYILNHWPLMSVEDLLAVKDFRSIVLAQQADTFSAESWAFVHYLLFARGPMMRHAFSAFWNASKQGLAPHEALIKALGPEGAAQIDAALQSYLRSIRFTVSLPFDTSGRNLGTFAPADPVAVQLALAKVDYVDRPDRAATYADAAVALAPNRPEGYEMRAEILIRTQAKPPVVTAAIKAAIAHGSHAAWVLTADGYDEIRAAGGKAAPPAQARAVVNQAEKAIRADRHYRPAFDLLAKTLYYADHVTADDGKFLALGRTQFPEDRWILIGQAGWSRRTGVPGDAAVLESEALAPSPPVTAGELSALRAYVAAWPPLVAP